MKAKDRLLDITAELTCGVVNGRRMRVRPVIKPPWAKKRPERDSELSADEDSAGPEGSAEPNSELNKEQLKELSSQRGWPHFKDVFMLSSVDREDVETLKVHTYGHSKNNCVTISKCAKHMLKTSVVMP